MSNFESLPSEEENLGENEEEKSKGESSAEIIPMEELALEEKEKEEKIPEPEPGGIMIEGLDSPGTEQIPEQTENKENEAAMKPEQNTDLEGEEVKAARIENIKREIQEMNQSVENLPTREENQPRDPSIKITNIASAERGGGGGGGSGQEVERKIMEEMNKPPLWKRLLFALFGISWETPKSSGGGKNTGGGKSSASSQTEISLNTGKSNSGNTRS